MEIQLAETFLLFGALWAGFRSTWRRQTAQVCCLLTPLVAFAWHPPLEHLVFRWAKLLSLLAIILAARFITHRRPLGHLVCLFIALNILQAAITQALGGYVLNPLLGLVLIALLPSADKVDLLTWPYTSRYWAGRSSWHGVEVPATPRSASTRGFSTSSRFSTTAAEVHR